jgi:hypothetical protein
VIFFALRAPAFAPRVVLRAPEPTTLFARTTARPEAERPLPRVPPEVLETDCVLKFFSLMMLVRCPIQFRIVDVEAG